MPSSKHSRPLNHELPPEPLQTIEIPEIDTQDPEDIQIKNCRYIGSFNWAPGSDQSDPVLFVPGSPREWVERPLPITVQPDRGRHFRDRNGHISPGRPLLPLLAAVTDQNIQPPIEWGTVDFVSDRNGLRKLLRWIRGTGKDFRIDMELVGSKTIFLNRWEQKTVDYMNGTTYGFAFEGAVTRLVPGCEGIPGHARIVTYDLAGLKMVVQFEVDAYYPQNQQQQASSPTTSTNTADQLAEAISNIDISQDKPGQLFGLGIIHRGNANIPQNSIVELSTTTRHLDWKERYPQLFFSQTQHHVLARHNQLQLGTFIRLDKREINVPQLQATNARLQPAFKKLRAALQLIQQVAIEQGQNRRLTLLCTNKRLEVYRRGDQNSCLPEDALALFSV